MVRLVLGPNIVVAVFIILDLGIFSVVDPAQVDLGRCQVKIHLKIAIIVIKNYSN